MPLRAVSAVIHELRSSRKGKTDKRAVLTCAHIHSVELDRKSVRAFSFRRCCVLNMVRPCTADEGGATRMSGGIPWITLPAGYLGSSLIGAALIVCGFDTNAAKIASLAMAAFFLFTLWWARKSWMCVHVLTTHNRALLANLRSCFQYVAADSRDVRTYRALLVRRGRRCAAILRESHPHTASLLQHSARA